MICFMITAIICQQPPLINSSTNNALSSISAWKLDDVIRYTCDIGYLFSDGHSVKDLRCTETTEWSDMTASCKCKLPW